MKNETGLISSLTNSGAGTTATDKAAIIYTAPVPPALLNVIAANTDQPSDTLDVADYQVSSGGTVVIKWTASDPVNLGTTPISIYYTTDESQYTLIQPDLANAGNGGCTLDHPGTTLDDGSTGCYVWSGGAPASSFRIRVVATNAADLSAASSSRSLNAGNILGLAGNTDTGVGFSATSAILNIKSDPAPQCIHQFVVLPNGWIVTIDHTYGIMGINPSDGLYKVLVPLGGSGGPGSDGDGLAITDSAVKVRSPGAITSDSAGNVYIWDYDRIRKIDTQVSPWTIDTLVGGGASLGSGIVGTDAKISAVGLSTSCQVAPEFHVRPDGKVYFLNGPGSYMKGTTSDASLAVYDPDTQLLTKTYFGGVGDSEDPGADLTLKRIYHLALQYDPATSETEYAFGTLNDNLNHMSCASFDVATMQSITPSPVGLGSVTQPTVGMDGRIYRSSHGGQVSYWESDSQSWINVLGNSGTGYCEDDEDFSTCSNSIDDIFVTAQGKIYWREWGLIRTVDGEGHIVTVAGQTHFFGDGEAAMSARIGAISSMVRKSTGEIVFLDGSTRRIRQLNAAGTSLDPIAGTGANATPNTTDLAVNQSLLLDVWADTYNITLNDSDEIIYSRSHQISKISSVTGKWEDIVDASGTISYVNGDNVVPVLDSSYLPNIVGFDGTHIVAALFKWSVGGYYDAFVKMYDESTGVQSPFAGMVGVGANDWPTGDAVDLTTNLAPRGNYLRQMAYDATTSLWYAGNGERVRTLQPAGLIDTLFYDPNSGTNITGLAISRASGDLIVYYCGSGRLKKWSSVTDVVTALSWPVASMSCTDGLEVDPDDGSLIFSYTQNELAGIARYLNP